MVDGGGGWWWVIVVDVVMVDGGGGRSELAAAHTGLRGAIGRAGRADAPALAIFVASINIAGGFLVTQRMLSMFRKK